MYSETSFPSQFLKYYLMIIRYGIRSWLQILKNKNFYLIFLPNQSRKSLAEKNEKNEQKSSLLSRGKIYM